ncbi:hypothetical protein P167DRAFT_608964 [Morchella conica CCBAS932]|uniref:Uncharacterized protein n=1 Tax=Morchella conica CCBAS932 TaxID=1392247 RepID=A0A3N4KF49_9PEZI|nr:hypothetical protein P167DRAFT_608964 [Morchella conica CCBAS932]
MDPKSPQSLPSPTSPSSPSSSSGSSSSPSSPSLPFLPSTPPATSLPTPPNSSPINPIAKRDLRLIRGAKSKRPVTQLLSSPWNYQPPRLQTQIHTPQDLYIAVNRARHYDGHAPSLNPSPATTNPTFLPYSGNFVLDASFALPSDRQPLLEKIRQLQQRQKAECAELAKKLVDLIQKVDGYEYVKLGNGSQLSGLKTVVGWYFHFVCSASKECCPKSNSISNRDCKGSIYVSMSTERVYIYYTHRDLHEPATPRGFEMAFESLPAEVKVQDSGVLMAMQQLEGIEREVDVESESSVGSDQSGETEKGRGVKPKKEAEGAGKEKLVDIQQLEGGRAEGQLSLDQLEGGGREGQLNLEQLEGGRSEGQLDIRQLEENGPEGQLDIGQLDNISPEHRAKTIPAKVESKASGSPTEPTPLPTPTPTPPKLRRKPSPISIPPVSPHPLVSLQPPTTPLPPFTPNMLPNIRPTPAATPGSVNRNHSKLSALRDMVDAWHPDDESGENNVPEKVNPFLKVTFRFMVEWFQSSMGHPEVQREIYRILDMEAEGEGEGSGAGESDVEDTVVGDDNRSVRIDYDDDMSRKDMDEEEDIVVDVLRTPTRKTPTPDSPTRKLTLDLPKKARRSVRELLKLGYGTSTRVLSPIVESASEKRKSTDGSGKKGKMSRRSGESDR